MRKKLLIIMTALFFILLSACKETYEDKASSVYVFTINDTHGAFYNDGVNPGMENIGGLLNSLYKKSPDYIKIAVGDIFQGSYISNIHYGLPQIESLNIMGFHAFVIGNHEFDWGLEKIAAYADGNPDNGEADFPFLAANIVRNGSKLPWTKDYVIVEKGGYKVGIIGVIGYGLESSIAADKVEGYTFLNPVGIVKNLTKQLRGQEGCDLVIVAIHGYDTYFNYEVSDFPEESFVDAIICGHTHQKIEDYVLREDEYNIPIIQNYDKNESAGEIVFNFSEDGKLLDAEIYHYNPAAKTYREDTAVLRLIDSYADDIAAGDRVIGHTTEALYKDRIGREMTAAMNEKFHTDVAFINTGGVRSTLKPGLITVNDIFQVFPFDNAVIVTEISGYRLSGLYSENRSYLYFNDDFPFTDINPADVYNIAIIDYVYLDRHYTWYFNEYEPDFTDVLARDVFVDYIEDYYKD